MQNYGTFHKKAYITDSLLIHAKLMTESDDRLEESAELIFAKYIEDRKNNSFNVETEIRLTFMGYGCLTPNS